MSLLGKWFGFNRDEVLEEGISAYDRGDYETAIEALEACLTDAESEAMRRVAALVGGDAYAQLGSIRAEQGEYGEARTLFRQAIRLNPTHPHLFLKAGLASFAMGHIDEAERLIRQAYEVNPQSVEPLLALAVLSACRGRSGEANEVIDRAARLDAELDRSVIASIRRMSEGDGFDDVLRNLGIVVGGDALLFKRVGIGLLRTGNVEEAIQTLDRAVTIAPRYLDARYWLVHAYLAAGRTDEALRIDPAVVESHALREIALQLLREATDARGEPQLTHQRTSLI